MSNPLGSFMQAMRTAFGQAQRVSGVAEMTAPPYQAEDQLALYWEKVPLIERIQQTRLRGGDPDRYASVYDYALSRWGGPLPRRPLTALCVGCRREPPVPEQILATERVVNVVVVDNDAVRLENLLERNIEGVECWQMDLNVDPLPKGPFDLVACYDTLHRLRELEHIFAEFDKVMSRGGLLVCRDYIGPNRLQFPEELMQLVNATLQLLPEELRIDESGEVREAQYAPGLDQMLRLDPTKAIRSESILGIAKSRLKMLEIVPMGGSLMAPLLAGLAENFRETTPETDRILQALLDVEMRLVQGGMIASHYAFFVGRKE